MLYRNEADLAIWKEVYIDNIYELPEDMTGWGMIDVGAHIGSATVRALDCGAEYVVAVEPLPSNFSTLKANTNIYRKLKLCDRWNYAVVSDMNNRAFVTLSQLNDRQEGCISTVWWEPSSVEVKTTKLVWPKNELLRESIKHRVLKIDCEGAEHDILTYSDLRSFDLIVGEIHEVPAEVWRDGIERTKESLINFLTSAGFNVSITKQIDEQLTIFKAQR